jgi:hypothetical protein
MKRSVGVPGRRGETAIEESRRSLYVGAGLCLGSAFGYVAASVVGSTVAMALFGAAVPILACQVGLEYRLLGRLRRERTEDERFGAPTRWTTLVDSRIDPLRGIVNELRGLR